MLKAVFWAIIGFFVFIVSQLFIPQVRELFKGTPFFLLPIAIFSLLGGVLLFLTRKEKVKGKLKKFLTLTGASSLGFFLSIVLHNFFYALAIIVSHFILLKYLMEVLHGFFFIVAIIICPIGFMIGTIGSILLFIKKKD